MCFGKKEKPQQRSGKQEEPGQPRADKSPASDQRRASKRLSRLKNSDRGITIAVMGVKGKIQNLSKTYPKPALIG